MPPVPRPSVASAPAATTVPVLTTRQTTARIRWRVLRQTIWRCRPVCRPALKSLKQALALASCCGEEGEKLSLLDLRLVQRNRPEPERCAWCSLGQGIQAAGRNGSELWIAADGLAVIEQHDGLPVGRNLNGAQAGAFRY